MRSLLLLLLPRPALPRSTLHRPTRSLHTSRHSQASVLFALSALSNSRETQHFNKLTRLARVEHSPSLKLIQTSEIDPFLRPEAGKRPPKHALPAPTVRLAAHPIRQTRHKETGSAGPTTATRPSDSRALLLGRALLADHARHVSRLRHALDKSRARERARGTAALKERATWASEKQRMSGEVRAAGLWILVSVGVATGLAMSRFWPAPASAQAAAGTGGKVGMDAAGVSNEAVASGTLVPVTGSAAAEPVVLASTAPGAVNAPLSLRSGEVVGQTSGSWWKSLFWKQR